MKDGPRSSDMHKLKEILPRPFRPLSLGDLSTTGKLKKIFRGPYATSNHLLFFQKNGRSYSESCARKLWNRLTSEMGVKISFYQGTRHSSATEAVNRVGMDRVQEFLGHTRSAMTKRYAKMNPEGLKSVLREK